MKKRILILLMQCCWGFAYAEMVNPVVWTGEDLGDSVRLTAQIEAGWHMSLFDIAGQESEDETEYSESYSIVLPKNAEVSVRYNACNDAMCTAPELYAWEAGTGKQETGTGKQETGSEKQDTGISGTGLWQIFWLGLLGGLLAIFTPCVWPIIPMTVSFFLKRDGNWRSVVAFGLSIIIIYVGLGLLVTGIFGASALNALSTNAVMNLIFFAVLVAFALSFFGLFEITLPSSWSTRMDARARETSGLISILFMAFTLVIVSFSCTGPIIGTLLVEAAGRSLLAPAIGMLGFAIALALPFSLFALFPEWMRRVPRSGGWMQSLKVVLAFIELALSLKFLSVADMAYGWGILPRWLFILLWIICFAAMALYLAWGFRQVSAVRKVLRSVLILLSVAFVAYLIPGLNGAPVRLISAFAPPTPLQAEEVFTDFDQGMAYARQTGQNVVVEFTGYGCVNCRKMEAYVLQDERVQERLQKFVHIRLYVDERKDGRGVRNSQLEAELIQSNAQPYWVMLSPAGEAISAPIGYTPQPEKFMEWLNSIVK